MALPMTRAQPYEQDMVECWDDDDDLQFNDGCQFHAASSTGSVTNSSFRPSGHRDSISSRRSARSDIDSNAGDEDWQVLLHDNDEFSKEEALASAKNAGIPIPADIPNSALVGGAIKRLSARKSRKTFVDDWSEDVELPGPDTILALKTPRTIAFPETLRQISSAATSPVKSTASPSWSDDIATRLQSTLANLDRLQDENICLVNGDVPTIKAPVPRSPQKNSGVTSDDFVEDLELPPGHEPLELSHRKENANVSSPILDDFDLEWSEGSIGVRVGGTARDGRSVPSSSISIASPSVSSCLTGESEEDGLDGLLFPDGPLDFTASLNKRQAAQDPDDTLGPERSQNIPTPLDADDFFSGIEIEDGRAFGSRKLTLNPNVKCKTEWPSSPTRRPATTLTFTNATGSPRTRIPRLSGNDRTLSTHLETVSESGAPLSKFRRSQSRLGHSSQSSVSSLPSSSIHPTSPTPIPSGRKLLGSRTSRDTDHTNDPKVPNRPLRSKRSMPSIRGVTSLTPPHHSQRAPSRAEGHTALNRPKTPVERAMVDVRTSTRRSQASFVPVGGSERQSHHSTIKNQRPSRRTNSDSSSDLLSPQGTFSRLSRSTRPEVLRHSFGETSPETARSGTTKRTLTRPTRRRNFGDGTELESFDDLPTSASTESRFVKHPAGRGAPRSVRARLSQSRITPPIESPKQSIPSASKPPNPTPRFARDTNASRNAREQRIASMNSRTRDANPLAAFSPNWKPHSIVSRISPTSAPVRNRKIRPAIKPPSKPHLIKPMGSGVHEAKSVRGMRYNPETFRWEGNENLIQDFDIATAPKSPKPAPALITNVGAMHNVQVVGGMVFDPQRMCWLKAASFGSGNNDGFSADEDDVFAGLDDLDDQVSGAVGRPSGALDELHSPTAGEDPSGGESSDEAPITEEFDVGPEFIRRQRAEEDKWRRKVDKWVGSDRGDRDIHWRWAIRDLV
ncbi:hypothetical protein N7462_000262 [Penicillium macrosclerotiorum]|uniref:uncharacterized protein n=1 Tax=Penicillium macrosclerotiorum TaxID=303699 RepID=UPI0025495057|nr:uncharacterized protein N7462_000262 [Penicillium macrosclerotiorum]KAJ5698257.1 hypothetical protein N7462_000262 [Penicillium macrosclerotiorum]